MYTPREFATNYRSWLCSKHPGAVCSVAIGSYNIVMLIYRSLVVWGSGVVVVLGAFLYFVFTGWPGNPDPCILTTPDMCFCEAFHPADVHNHNPGVRQPMNTWFNLYATGTSLWAAVVVCRDRKAARGQGYYSAEDTPLMRSESWIPDLYIFAILFLGLGSMWFHASLTSWAGNVDALSMYLFATFPANYSARRLWSSNRFFWIAYLSTLFVISMVHVVVDWDRKSLVLIVALVVLYLALEMTVVVKSGRWWGGRPVTVALWWGGFGAIALATLLWALSQTGQPLCYPNSRFQVHGVLWHPLAGIMALSLFFYWRSDEDTTFDRAVWLTDFGR